jgi:hypothetical protein
MMSYEVVLLKERPSGILNRRSEDAEYTQGKKDDTWEITRGFPSEEEEGSMIGSRTHVLSNQALPLNCNNEKELN